MKGAEIAMNVYTEAGTPLTLADPPIGKGGEGAIYRIDGNPGRVAKIYLDPADAASRRNKIEAMASISDLFQENGPLGTIAWPLGALYADPGAASFVGFGMRTVSTPITIDSLYEYPADPDANFSMLDKLCVIESVAALTDQAHKAGQVIGDYNDNNVAVLPGCRAALVDADSFHATIGGKTYPCAVCMPGYAAPEVLRNMHGFATYEDCTKETFTQKTDDWALAVHVFRTLFNGAHPYHCLPIPNANGSLPSVLPIDKRVERGETPFFTAVPGVKLPPFTPDADMLPPYLHALFERAFVAGHADPSRRPSAAEWQQAIARYKGDVRQRCCNQAHWYWEQRPSCPYCEADARAAKALRSIGAARSPHAAPKPAASGAAQRSAHAAAIVPRTASTGGAAARPANAGAAAAAAPAAAFTSLHLSKGAYWTITLLLSLAVVVAAGWITPAAGAVYLLLFGAYDPWMQGAVAVSGIAGTCLYNSLRADSDSPKHYVLATLSSLAGIVAAALALCLLGMLVSFVVSVITTVLVAVFIVAILIGLLNS